MWGEGVCFPCVIALLHIPSAFTLLRFLSGSWSLVGIFGSAKREYWNVSWILTLQSNSQVHVCACVCMSPAVIPIETPAQFLLTLTEERWQFQNLHKNWSGKIRVSLPVPSAASGSLDVQQRLSKHRAVRCCRGKGGRKRSTPQLQYTVPRNICVVLIRHPLCKWVCGLVFFSTPSSPGDGGGDELRCTA